jgi:hypothetical protein
MTKIKQTEDEEAYELARAKQDKKNWHHSQTSKSHGWYLT